MKLLKPWVRAHHIRKTIQATRRAAAANQRRILLSISEGMKKDPQHGTVETLGPEGFATRRQVGRISQVPSVLSFRSNYEVTAKFVNELANGINRSLDRPAPNPNRHQRRAQLRNPSPMGSYWDFSTVNEISILPALMIAAQYDRARILRPTWRPKAINVHRWEPQVRRFLEEVGFLELCGVRDKTEEMLHYSDVSLLRFRRGETVDGQAVGEYFAQLGIDLGTENPMLYDAITEAITNVINHAYGKEQLNPAQTVKAWWLCAMLKTGQAHKELSIVVYDQGASIPRTLPYSTKYESIKKSLLDLFGIDFDSDDPTNDAKAISCAMRPGASATGESHRGRGLAQIVEVLDLSLGGHLSIYSRQGSVEAKKSPGGSVEISPVNRAMAIIGTAIVWHLVL